MIPSMMLAVATTVVHASLPSASLMMVMPEEVLSIGSIALMLVAAWGGQGSTRLISWAAVAVLVGAMIALLGPASSGGVAFDGLFRADAFAAFSKVLIYGASAVAILMAPRFFQQTSGDNLRPEYPVLILLSACGMGMMVSAGDLLVLYVGLELQSLAAYVLASFMRRDTRSAEAGLKYFVLGALASGILLYGISLVYGFSGTTLFSGIAEAYAGIAPGTHNYGLMFGLVFVFAGLAFKMSAVPFHMWTPDVYEGAPTPVTAFFASAPKVAAMGLAVRVAVEAMGPAVDQWRQIVIFASLASIIFGAVAAIGQSNIKRLLAYSSINNVGFVLVGLAAGTQAGVAAVLFYLTVYVVMTLGGFLVVLQMRGPDGQPVETISSLSGMSRTRPGLALAMAIFMFSLAGIPPLLGFNAKLAVFNAAVEAGLYPLAVVGFVASVIGAYYYLRVIKVMYFDEPVGEGFPKSGDFVEGGLITAAAVFVSPVGWVLLAPLGLATMAAAKALF
jgi:NADH-quinone oxidoreductase subunit N